MNTVVKAQEIELNIGDETTCQFGNPGDTGWTEEADGCVPVKVVLKEYCDMTKRMYYLVVKLDNPEYLGRAAVSRTPRHKDEEDSPQGVLYCTNARTFGASAQTWTGIRTFAQAARSLSFYVPE